jgi:hypothetical protein
VTGVGGAPAGDEEGGGDGGVEVAAGYSGGCVDEHGVAQPVAQRRRRQPCGRGGVRAMRRCWCKIFGRAQALSSLPLISLGLDMRGSGFFPGRGGVITDPH